MAFDVAKRVLEERGFGDRVMEFECSSATVALAAVAVGTEPARIAKSVTFCITGEEEPYAAMILCAGDTKVNNSKFKSVFHCKAKMLTPEQVRDMVGQEIGGVCPFGCDPRVRVFLDESLKRFDIVYPACGSDNSAVKLSIEELEKAADCRNWIDVCNIAE